MNPSSQTSCSQPLWTKLITTIGLPCLISVAAIDPGNLEVDLQAGSILGYRLIWALLLSSIVGWIMQALAAHLTVQTSQHLASLFASAYSNHPLIYYSIFIITELSIIAFDIAEVVGTAFALKLLFGFPLWLGMIASALDTLLVLYLQKNGTTIVEIIIEGMLFILAICLFYEFFLAKPSIPKILDGTFIPRLGNDRLQSAILAVGMLGSVVMAHNLFLHSWLMKGRQDRKIRENGPIMEPEANSSFRSTRLWSQEMIPSACHYATMESLGIFVATFIINTVVLSLTAALPRESFSGIGELGLMDAGALFQNVLGTKIASTAWAVALLSSGHAATVTGTLASQAVCEGFLQTESSSAGIFVIITRGIAIIPAVIAALFAGEKGSDNLIVMSQVVLSVALPFAILPLLKLFHALYSNSQETSRWLVQAGTSCFVLLFIANLFVVWEVNRELASVYGPIAGVYIGILGLLASIILIKILITTPDLTDIQSYGLTEDSDEEQPLLTRKSETTQEGMR